MTSSAGTRSSEPGVRGRTVLIADDDPSVRRLLRLALELEGFTVSVAADGEAALEAAMLEHPSAVVLDAVMPGLGGGEVCRRLRSELGWAMTVLVLTGQRDVLDRVAAFDCGADDYVEKPARVAEVVRRVKERVASSDGPRGRERLLEGTDIHAELRRRIEADAPVAVVFASMRGLRLFADRYGFERGDGLIGWLGGRVADSAEAFPRGCAGRAGIEDYLALVDAQDGPALCARISEEFRSGVARWYDPPDAHRGWIEVRDRLGHVRRSRFVCLSLGLAANRPERLHHYALLERAAQVARSARDQRRG